MSNTAITAVSGRRVWDSRGRPTVEAEVRLRYGARGLAIAPAGASMGTGEAVELRDGGEVLGGHGVAAAVAAVDTDIAKRLKGMDAADQGAIDKALIKLDGTADKSRLGGNALIAVSLATARAAAEAKKVPLWQHLAATAGRGTAPPRMPLPQIQIFGGGAHASRRVDIQDFMAIPIGAASFAQALEWCAEVYRAAGRIMEQSGRLRGVADEGGFWPDFDSNEAAIEALLRAIEGAGLEPGRDVAIALDIAASEFGSSAGYTLTLDGRQLSGDEFSGILVDWCERYPIVSIEDPLAEGDKEGMVRFTWAVGRRTQVVGDDFLVTDAERIRAAARAKACNAALIKPNQAGTLSETLAALKAARRAGFGAIVSARSGESEDTAVIHLAVGWGAGQLKVGSITRGERTAKWNEGLRIAESMAGLDPDGPLPPAAEFPWGKRR